MSEVLEKLNDSKVAKFNRLKERREKAKQLSDERSQLIELRHQITDRLKRVPLVVNELESFTMEELANQINRFNHQIKGKNIPQISISESNLSTIPNWNEVTDVSIIMEKCPWLIDSNSLIDGIYSINKDKVNVKLNDLSLTYNGGICYEYKKVIDESISDCEDIEILSPLTSSPIFRYVEEESNNEIIEFQNILNLSNLSANKAIELCLEKIQDGKCKTDITLNELKDLAKADFRKCAYLKIYLKLTN